VINTPSISKVRIIPLFVLYTFTILFASNVAQAVTCQRGTLDAKYCDADEDLVADIPSDKNAFVDPNPLIFSYTPVEDPAVYAKVWDSFLKHLEQKTGKKVIFFPVQSNAAQIEAMRAGRLHIGGFNTGSTPLAVNCAGFIPFAIMAGSTDNFGYEMEIITFPGSGINKIEDLKGKKLAFTSKTSNSGFKAPSALLKDKFNLVAERDFTPVYSGKHDNSVLGVANKDYPAAAIANEVMFRMIDRGVIKKDQIKTIYKSQTFPTTGYGMVYNLKPELAAQIKEAFFTFPWKGSQLEKEFAKSGVTKFAPITYSKNWEIIRTIDKAVGVSYNCK